MRIKPRLVLWTVGLIAVLLASACAPGATSQSIAAEPMETQTPLATTTNTQGADTLTPDTSALSSTPTSTAQLIATSRGPNLEATDPTTVNLASGQVQFVEFFRFT